MPNYRIMSVSYDLNCDSGRLVQSWREANRIAGIADSEAVRRLIIEAAEQSGKSKALEERLKNVEMEISRLQAKSSPFAGDTGIRFRAPGDNETESVTKKAAALAAKFISS